MLHLMGKTVVAIGVIFMAGYGAECGLNAKLDEELCIRLGDASPNDIIKFNLILRQPVIEQPDTGKLANDEAFSKYRLDSLANYLEANKQKIVSLLTGHQIYTVESSDSPERVSESNITVDFNIPVAASKATILALADAGDLVVKIEHFTESGPASISIKDDRRFSKGETVVSPAVTGGRSIHIKLTDNSPHKIICYDLNGRVIRKWTVTLRHGKYAMTAYNTPSLNILTIVNGRRQSNHGVMIQP